MQPFTQWLGVAAPLLRANIDTDAIIPSREMKSVSKLGLGEGLFAGERYLPDSRDPNSGFVLNSPAYRDASILLAGNNFGCGSSREHAVWALREYGIRAIIAVGFGSIFRSNCIRNGLLPVVLPELVVRRIAAWVAVDPQMNRVGIDLEALSIEAEGTQIAFDCDEGARQMLLKGLDAIDLTLTRRDAIAEFITARRQSRPWLFGRFQ